MRFQVRLFIIFLSLLVILPVFLLNTKPVFAFASHIVRLKYQDGSPVVNKMVILRAGEYHNCSCPAGMEERWCWCHDCSRSVDYTYRCGHCNVGHWTGPTWTMNTDSNGTVVFSARAASNAGGGIGDGDIQTCSTGRNMRIGVALADLNSGGHWQLDSATGSIGSVDWRRESSPNVCLKGSGGQCSTSSNCPTSSSSSDEILRYHVAGDEEWCKSWWDEGWQRVNSFPVHANLASTYLTYDCWGGCSGDGPGKKTTNIYWEWTWVGSQSQAQNTQNQPLLALAGSLLTSLLAIFR